MVYYYRYWLDILAEIRKVYVFESKSVAAVLSAIGERARFRMRVTLGVVLIRSLVNTKHIPGRLRSDSGVALK